MSSSSVITTNIPARLDRLPWSRWHWLVVIGLGAVWVLDGLEVTSVGVIGGRLTEPGSGLALSKALAADAGSVYVAGAVVGALFFGYLTDRFGRKKLFLWSLGLYLVATLATAGSWTAWFFFLCRFFTGCGIGGEYAAINSAIDELIPARLRGRIDIFINGSFWAGTVLAAALSLVLLDQNLVSADLGWRLAFVLGASLGVGVLVIRRLVPESPRWLFIHRREDEAERIVRDIEEQVAGQRGIADLPAPSGELRIEQRASIGFLTIAKTVLTTYPRRTVVGLSLFVGQAFLYNAVFFSYAVFLTTFFKVSAADVGYYVLPFAAGNLLGPLLLGRFYDTIGRRFMISGTYILTAVLLFVTAWLFNAGMLTATTQTVAWAVIFFFGSAGTSAAYLTVSEIFPMETRAMAIAFFYALGTGAGGIIGPALFGVLISSGMRWEVAIGDFIACGLMLGAGLAEALLGVDAERMPLEAIARPLTARDGPVQSLQPA